jgi:hypothetical protein
LEHGFYDFPKIWEWNNHPNWRSPSFFRGVGWNHQAAWEKWKFCDAPYGMMSSGINTTLRFIDNHH